MTVMIKILIQPKYCEFTTDAFANNHSGKQLWQPDPPLSDSFGY